MKRTTGKERKKRDDKKLKHDSLLQHQLEKSREENNQVLSRLSPMCWMMIVWMLPHRYACRMAKTCSFFNDLLKRNKYLDTLLDRLVKNQISYYRDVCQVPTHRLITELGCNWKDVASFTTQHKEEFCHVHNSFLCTTKIKMCADCSMFLCKGTKCPCNRLVYCPSCHVEQSAKKEGVKCSKCEKERCRKCSVECYYCMNRSCTECLTEILFKDEESAHLCSECVAEYTICTSCNFHEMLKDIQYCVLCQCSKCDDCFDLSQAQCFSDKRVCRECSVAAWNAVKRRNE